MNLDEATDTLTALARSAPPVGGTIRLTLEGVEARLEIDHPTAHNAITLGMMVELARAVARLRTWDGAFLSLVAIGSGAFCSGGHLGQVRAAVRGPDGAIAMARAMTAVLDAILALPVISVARLDGQAIGGGAELATATDFRVAGPAARLQFVHAGLGIAPGWGGAGRLAQHVGSRVALNLLASARSVDPEEALRLGLVDGIGASAADAAVALVGPMRAHAPVAIRAVKAQIAATRRGDRSAEALAFSEVWGGPAHVAALAARGRG